MLHHDSITTAWSLAEELAAKGQVVRPRTNTVLEQLVRLCPTDLTRPQEIEVPPADVPGYYGTYLENTTQGTPEAPSEHDQALNALQRDIALAVTQHVGFARNIVKPLILDYIERVSKALETLQPRRASDLFDIVIQDLPEICEDATFLSDIGSYTSQSVLTPDLKPTLGDKSPEEILALLSTGQKALDGLLVTWYGRLGEDFFTRCWYSFFSQNPAPVKGILCYAEVGNLDVFAKADIATFLYIVAGRLYEAVDDSAQGVSLQVYKNTMAQIRDYGGALLAACLKLIQNFEQSKTMVIKLEEANYRALVVGKLYREWLKTGGHPEVILGLIVSGKLIANQVALDTAAPGLLERWQNFSNLFDVRESNQAFTNFRTVLKLEFDQLMGTLTEEEQGYVKEDPSYYQKSIKLVDEVIAGLKTSDMPDLYGTALKIVCRGRFYYTDAEKILSGMEDVRKANPHIDPREAALLSTLEYVCTFLADQFQLDT
jgi:hypothetical protein